jgi:hypothetical protein
MIRDAAPAGNGGRRQLRAVAAVSGTAVHVPPASVER